LYAKHGFEYLRHIVHYGVLSAVRRAKPPLREGIAQKQNVDIIFSMMMILGGFFIEMMNH
jgi:hypothetical protein